MNDEDVQRLVGSVGPRDTPPAEVRERVRHAVRNAWEDLAPVRRGGAATNVFVLAACIAVAAVCASLVWLPGSAAPAVVVGEVAYATGGHVVANSQLAAPLLATGATVETPQQGRVLVRLTDGALIRLDGGTKLTLHAAAVVGLSHGRLFVDSAGSGIAVVTPSRVRVQSVGTQFEVGVEDERVVVAVRQGRLEVHAGGRSIRSEALDGIGEALVLAGGDVVLTERVSATGARWDWIHASVPAFELNGATVFEFLAWATAETGFALEFANERVARHAKAVRLHGPPVRADRIDREGIQATLATVPSLRVVQSKSHALVIDWQSSVTSAATPLPNRN